MLNLTLRIEYRDSGDERFALEVEKTSLTTADGTCPPDEELVLTMAVLSAIKQLLREHGQDVYPAARDPRMAESLRRMRSEICASCTAPQKEVVEKLLSGELGQPGKTDLIQ